LSQRLTKTDNKSIANKIFIRKESIKYLKEVKILDLFAGRNVLWNNIETDKYYGIDLEQNKGRNLIADTREVFDSLDLSKFNVIDCDSYGIPYDIYHKILTRKDVRKGTIVLYTAIAYEFTGLQNEIKELFHFDKFYSKAPTLFNKKAIDFFYELLSLHGVDEVNFYSVHDPIDKHYGYFIIK
jgi:hypothetical protein